MTSAIRPPGIPSSLSFHGKLPSDSSCKPPDLLIHLDLTGSSAYGPPVLRTHGSDPRIVFLCLRICSCELPPSNCQSNSLVWEKKNYLCTHSQDEKNIKACGLFLPPDLVSPIWLFWVALRRNSRGHIHHSRFCFSLVISVDLQHLVCYSN